jgi:hypothetical protein
MHKAVIINDQASLDQLNNLLEDDWWIHSVTAGGDGNSWFIVVTDSDPEDLLLDGLSDMADDDMEDYDNIEYERH